MQKWLYDHFQIRAQVLYDRPGDMFSLTPPSLIQRHSLLSKLHLTDSSLFPDLMREREREKKKVDETEREEEYTIQTCWRREGEKEGKGERGTERITLREDRALVVVSCTSWTPDEDFTPLLSSLTPLDAALGQLADKQPPSSSSSSSSLSLSLSLSPRVVFLVTGKGPLRSVFESHLRALSPSLSRVAVRTLWLEPADYPLLLGCADLGVCLHTSTSGLDLPMKVLDMFGSGVPVVAAWFPSLSELVEERETGVIFRDERELEGHLVRLLCESPGEREREGEGVGELKQLREGVYRKMRGVKRGREGERERGNEEGMGRWEEAW
eukprot:CAMPEP_0182421578 /NCGR_PEP_ID=MMETSP1167-20130531/6985_1 /TAXON_ID=2988 /ORGANISM="Mallomonas Sp, Strain CCMP3275" /LENGTH=324 /DNA_ID=CAMNT_0024598829 /DNA_START=630 /DNA_END=1601 /DNA_ORIENTATION=+